MLRQIHVFNKGKQVYNFVYAMALGDEELENVKKTLKSYIDMPMPGKTFQKPLGEFQIFHRAIGNTLFLLITDLVDTREHIDGILEKIIKTFKEIYPEPDAIKKKDSKLKEFEKFLQAIQYELHSKIVIIGPADSGKTTLFNILKSNEERNIMKFAKASLFQIDNLKFDIWDFQLKDNFSLLWPKFISGADLILLLFDLSNYHLRVIDHFLSLQRNEGKLSKLLIIGNKRDLINEEDIKLIKNELGIPKFEEISLKEPDARENLIKLITKDLRLKKPLPSHFDQLKKEAEKVKAEGNFVLAISKYKELINICNSYQDFTYITLFKQILEELQNKVEEEKRIRRERESKKKFELPGQIRFTEKVSVKPLPIDKSKIRTELTPKVTKPEVKVNISKTKEAAVGKLTLFKTSKDQEKEKKKILTPEDFEIEMSPLPKKPVQVTEQEETPFKKSPKLLQELIEKRGSSLSLKLCEHLVNELQATLGRSLTLKDLETAADIFIKQESL